MCKLPSDTPPDDEEISVEGGLHTHPKPPHGGEPFHLSRTQEPHRLAKTEEDGQACDQNAGTDLFPIRCKCATLLSVQGRWTRPSRPRAETPGWRDMGGKRRP